MRDRSHSGPPPRAPIASPNKEQKFDWQALWQIERPALLAFRSLSRTRRVLMRITQSMQTPACPAGCISRFIFATHLQATAPVVDFFRGDDDKVASGP